MPLESDHRQLAVEFFQKAYERQMHGEYDEAIALYTQSIEAYPTAEAYTFRGWTCSMLGNHERAIADCLEAINVDPEFGNPYNDIGAYLIEKGEYDDAISWLERALQSRRYESYHYPHYNLGRVYVAKEMFVKARQHFEQALKLSPDYTLAKEGLEQIRRKLQ
jgi:tetratricopeptide (TPR) repeat protein